MFSFRRCVAILLLSPALANAAAKVYTPAPDFSLPNTRGQIRTLASYKGKIVFIDFWASWCATCQLELPQVARLASTYEGKNVRVVAVNVDTDRQLAKQLLQQLHLDAAKFEILWDKESKMVSRYDIEAMPASFIIDPRGTIRFQHLAYHESDPSLWRREIDSLSPTVEKHH